MDSEPHPEFHSAETGKPFRDCISCGLGLDHDPALPYLVAKSYHRTECIFEYAICDDCRSNMSEEFSIESRQALGRFFEERVKMRERSHLLTLGNGPEPWIEKCAACRTPRNQLETYSLGGILLGIQMVYDPYPLCLCGECEEEIQSLLSLKTRGMWDEFLEHHFDGPPADMEDLPVRGRPALF